MISLPGIICSNCNGTRKFIFFFFILQFTNCSVINYDENKIKMNGFAQNKFPKDKPGFSVAKVEINSLDQTWSHNTSQDAAPNKSNVSVNSPSNHLPRSLDSRERLLEFQIKDRVSFGNQKVENLNSQLAKFKRNYSLEKEPNNAMMLRKDSSLNSDIKFQREKNISDILVISKRQFLDFNETANLIPETLKHFDKFNTTESELILIDEFLKNFTEVENKTFAEVFSVLSYFEHLYGNTVKLPYPIEVFQPIPPVHYVDEPMGNGPDTPICIFSDNVQTIIKELAEMSFCFLIQSENECIKNLEGFWVPKIGILCNETVQIDSINRITNSTFKNWVADIDIRGQKSLNFLRSEDFSEFRNLTILSITNTALESIEDHTFADLRNLRILNLSSNLIRYLSWKIFLPRRIHNRFQKNFPILLDGNPLSKEDCGTEWIFERLEKNSSESWILEKEVSSPEIISESSEKKFFDREKNAYKVNRMKRDRWQVNEQQGFPLQENFECLSSKYSEDQCYLCSPRLSFIRRTSDVLEIECKVGGTPHPKVQWEIASGRVLTEENITLTQKVVISIISLNSSLSIKESHSSNSSEESTEFMKGLASCYAYNDRGFEYRSVCDLEVLSLQKLRPISAISKVKIEVKISSSLFFLDPKTWKWSFSPCVDVVTMESNLTFTIDDKTTDRMIIEGLLHYTKSDLQGLLPGWYKLEVATPCGRVDNVTQYYDGSPNQNSYKECPLKHPFQSLIVSTDASKVNAETTLKTVDPTDYEVDTYEVDNYHAGLWNNTTASDDSSLVITTTPSLIIGTSTLGLLSAILIGVFSVLIVMVWISAIIVMRHWRGNRIFFPQNASSNESPFKIVFLGCLCREKDGESKKDSSAEFSRHEMRLLNPDRLVENPEYLSGSESEDLENWNQPQVIPTEKLKFVTELGEGAFGRVYLGLMEESDGKTVKVAVKTLKALGPESQQDVKREVEMLSNLQHEKIIKFHGVCHDPEAMFMIFEYMEHGDLNHYLKLHNEDCGLVSNDIGGGGEPLTVMDCLQIALQIASGMTYLASQHYVHRDLATRNCLVSGNLTVKIGDFGMSRDVYTSDYYQIGGRALLPIRWMPPESILYRRFTIESDIWSFGVVLWEIFTGGKQPWYGYTNQEVITQITAGKVLSCPDKCPPDMYRIMIACWHKQPHERTSMECLHRHIRALTTLQPHLVD